MSEKEERILITTRHKNEKLNMTFMDMYKEYTRQDAIERMAKALHSRSTVISDMEKDWGKLDESWRDSFCKYAEAALNALLEGK